MKFHGIFESQRRRSAIGFALSVLLHAALLLFALEHVTPPLKESGFLPDAPLVVNLLPPADASRAAPPAARTPPKLSKPRPAPVRRKPAPKQTPQLAQKTPPAPTPAPPARTRCRQT